MDNDREYLQRAVIETCVYIVTPEQLKIYTPETSFINIDRTRIKLKTQQELLEKYKTVLNYHKKYPEVIKINYKRQIKKQLLALWPEYAQEQKRAQQLYKRMYELCCNIKERKIHVGCSDDIVLAQLYNVKHEFERLYWCDTVISAIGSIDNILTNNIIACEHAVSDVNCISITFSL